MGSVHCLWTNWGGIKLLVNRHDIDTSPRVARKFFEIEKSVYGHEGSVTYYFRISTIDTKLISEIEEYGYETGYHYEEIATYEKKHKLKDRVAIERMIPQIRNEFVEGLKKFKDSTGSQSVSVASHGDFINTRCKFQNVCYLQVYAPKNDLKSTSFMRMRWRSIFASKQSNMRFTLRYQRIFLIVK